MTKHSTNKLEYKVVPLGRALDITGETYGRLIATHRVESNSERTRWLAQCECGNKIIVDMASLRTGNTRSCGCLHKEVATKSGRGKALDLTDKRFGRLIAINPTSKRSGGSIVWECKCDCGETTYVVTNHLSMGNIKSCGCLSLENVGEKHHMWNPNLTAKDREERPRQSGRTRKWRNKVYERDNYTCVLCGEVGGRLNAHHLNSWDKNKKERFDVDNGITLCRKEHKDFHHQYGYGSNTKKQFKEYQQALA